LSGEGGGGAAIERLSLTLTADELYEITHYRRAKEQLRELQAMGIKARRRHDGTICVLRADVAPSNEQPKPKPKLRL
jgi:hypothetical protein